MITFPEQFISATRAQLEVQIGLMNALTAKAFESAEKLIELNVNTTMASFDGASESVKELGVGGTPQRMFSAAVEKATPKAGKALDCSRQLTDIAASAHAKLTKAAEMQADEAAHAFEALIAQTAQSAPEGSERAIAVMRAIIDNSNVGFRQLNRNAKQAMDTLQFNLRTASSLLAQAAESAARSGAERG